MWHTHIPSNECAGGRSVVIIKASIVPMFTPGDGFIDSVLEVAFGVLLALAESQIKG